MAENEADDDERERTRIRASTTRPNRKESCFVNCSVGDDDAGGLKGRVTIDAVDEAVAKV